MSKVLYISQPSDARTRLLRERAAGRLDIREARADAPALELAAAATHAEVIVLAGDHLPNGVTESARGLRVVQLLGCSYEGADQAALAERGIIIAGASPALAASVADHTLALMLKVQSLAGLDARNTDADGISGRKVGIIGLGRVGSEVARRLNEWSANSVYFDVRTTPQGLAARLGLRRSTLDRLLTESDIVTIHIPHGPTADPLLEARELRLMPRCGVLINTAHARVIDQQALADALQDRRLAGAGLDVLDEGSPDSARDIRGMSGVLVTHGQGGRGPGADESAIEFAISNTTKALAGEPLDGELEQIDWPPTGDPAFWSSRMAPRAPA